jgi:hypothetical protein
LTGHLADTIPLFFIGEKNMKPALFTLAAIVLAAALPALSAASVTADASPPAVAAGPVVYTAGPAVVAVQATRLGLFQKMRMSRNYRRALHESRISAAVLQPAATCVGLHD